LQLRNRFFDAAAGAGKYQVDQMLGLRGNTREARSNCRNAVGRPRKLPQQAYSSGGDRKDHVP
jgi:hypothetical protein